MQSIKSENQIWQDNTIYFLTDSTYLHFPYFKSEEQKQVVLNQIKKVGQLPGVKIEDFSIAINHYHLKFYLEHGDDMAKIKQLLRGGISFAYKKKWEIPYSEIWQSRKILGVYEEKTNWRISGYIIGNLLKHKEVSTFEELVDCEFSSFGEFANKYGAEIAKDLVYSVIDLGEDAYGFVDLKSFK